MKKYIFILLCLLCMPLSVLDSVSGQADQVCFVKFDRPWMPQWEAGIETSNDSSGYRMENQSARFVMYGYGLDPGEQITVENRDSLERVITSGIIFADNRGWFFSRVNDELPDEFRSGYIYSVYFIRENGSEFKAGSFQVGENPPKEYFYLERGNLLAGFSVDPAGVPYLLSWLSYKDGPNILDNYKFERGREFQGDIIDGYPHAGDDWRWNTVIPCQGGGDYGRDLPTVISSTVNDNYIYAKTRPLDYEPWRDSMDGPYRLMVTKDRWPESGWMLESSYTLTENDVSLTNKFWHTDPYGHHVHQVRPAQVFLNPVFFQNGIMNESARDQDSYLKMRINDNRIDTYSVALGLRITFQGGVDGQTGFFQQRQWNYADYFGIAEPGTVEVWESLMVSEQNKFYDPNKPLSGWGVLTVSDSGKLGLDFDMAQFKDNLGDVWQKN